MMRAEEIMQRAMRRREAAGLILRFDVGRTEPFVCYPSTDKVRRAWIESAKRKGWKLLSDESGSVAVDYALIMAASVGVMLAATKLAALYMAAAWQAVAG